MMKETNMTAFAKSNFEYHGGYLHYTTDAGERKFVARFKHRGPVTKAKFLKTLIKNYTVEEYFAKLDAGRAPLQIFQDDGLLTFHYGENGGRNYFKLEGNAI